MEILSMEFKFMTKALGLNPQQFYQGENHIFVLTFSGDSHFGP